MPFWENTDVCFYILDIFKKDVNILEPISFKYGAIL